MKSLLSIILCTSLLCLTSACMLGPLDNMGVESMVTEDEDKSSEKKLEDDRIEDKKPKYDSTLKVTETFEGTEVTLNKSGSVTRLDIAPFGISEMGLDGTLFKGRAEAIKAVKEVRGDLLPSMEVVNGSMKPFNDGLYASIELGVQQGVSGILEGKLDLLQKLAAALKAAHAKATTGQIHLERAMTFLGTAIILGGATPDITATALTDAQKQAAAFKQQASLYARPIGFYTWNKTLEQIFAQDRWLQNYGGSSSTSQFGMFAAMAAVLEQDAALKARYEKVLALYSGLTNRYASHTPASLFPFVDGLSSLGDVDSIQKKFKAANGAPYVCTGNYFAFVPASRSKEMDYYKKKFCGKPPSTKTDLMDELIKAIRSGKVDLTPDKKSGWYEYQLHALETLLLPERGPESQNLLLTAAYKKKLVETFKSLITQTRETHVKQLSIGSDAVSAPPREIEIYPKFPVEPFPTFYLRNARAYRFLSTYLKGVLGQQFMASRRRLLEGGKESALPLDRELHLMTELLYGLYVLTARSVGLRPEAALLKEEMAEFEIADCVKRAQGWVAGWQTDADILSDPRVIVPIWHNSTNKQIIYWAVLGVKVIKISARFVETHKPEVVSCKNCKVKKMVPHDYHLLMEQMKQVRIGDNVPPPTRAEFRKICDKHKTADAIIKALESLKP